MSSEAESFAEEDEEAKRLAMNRHRLHMEVLDSLYDAEDNEAIASKLFSAEKETIRKEAATTRQWLNAHEQETSMEAIDAEWKRFTDIVKPILDQHRPKPPPPLPGEDAEDDDDDDDDDASASPEQKLDAALDRESKEEL